MKRVTDNGTVSCHREEPATRRADLDPPKSATVETKIGGTSSALHRPAVVFLHGFMGNAQDWNEIISFLEPDFECLAPDLPGHGAALVPESQPFPGMHRAAETVAQWLTERRIERYSLVGYSMGGRLALYMALRFPHGVERLVLESASP
ncbi:MAG: alpha/beta fold hydrolase, partial [Methanothrix sp.]|nr:alpha/beta fold hydrolase [Methanothrix sp.]